LKVIVNCMGENVTYKMTLYFKYNKKNKEYEDI
jgi:hypothetical protein